LKTHHHPAAPCAPADLPAPPAAAGTPMPATHAENASSLDGHTRSTPTGSRTTAPAVAGMMLGAFGVRSTSLAAAGGEAVRGSPCWARTITTTVLLRDAGG
jgi:hypothetical protein